MINLSDSRRKKLTLNTITSLLLQFTTIICGFILPRLILGAYGSEVNGLVNSIAQFLSIISLLDLGVGAVVQSALYKPLAENDYSSISKIYVSASKFFKKLALILMGYVVLLTFFFPVLINNKFDYIYTATLILAISISSFAQYYFGIVNSLLLSADQKGYHQYIAQIISLILNTIVCSILILAGGSIQMVKLTTSIIYLARPAYLMWYVKKKYAIDKRIHYSGEPIQQKWNGMAQHFAAFLILGTDNVILTLFSTLSNVSIYSVYHLVISGINNTFYSITNGFQSLLGDMIAKKEKKTLSTFFSLMEWMFHTGVTLVFGCTSILMLSFIQVYTNGVNDANYYQPVFSVLISLAYALHCLRLPYHILIKAAGHYKETQGNYIISTILNIVISVATVKTFGLVGVSIGTLVAMGYQTIWMAWYDSKNIIEWPFNNFVKQIFVDVLTFLTGFVATFKISLQSVSYYSWFVQALEVFSIWCVIVLIINLIFYRGKLSVTFAKIRGRMKKV